MESAFVRECRRALGDRYDRWCSVVWNRISLEEAEGPILELVYSTEVVGRRLFNVYLNSNRVFAILMNYSMLMSNAPLPVYAVEFSYDTIESALSKIQLEESLVLPASKVGGIGATRLNLEKRIGNWSVVFGLLNLTTRFGLERGFQRALNIGLHDMSKLEGLGESFLEALESSIAHEGEYVDYLEGANIPIDALLLYSRYKSKVLVVSEGRKSVVVVPESFGVDRVAFNKMFTVESFKEVGKCVVARVLDPPTILRNGILRAVFRRT